MRIRQHVNPLRADLLEIPLSPLALPAAQPVEVELGSAEAQFLFERAAEAPERCYVGIEIRRELVAQANRHGRQAGLAQVQSVFANISVDLPRLFAPASVARFFVNFPDPWWKQRQRKRRVVNEELVAQLLLLLAPGGESTWPPTSSTSRSTPWPRSSRRACRISRHRGASYAKARLPPAPAASATARSWAARSGGWDTGESTAEWWRTQGMQRSRRRLCVLCLLRALSYPRSISSSSS